MLIIRTQKGVEGGGGKKWRGQELVFCDGGDSRENDQLSHGPKKLFD